MLAHLNGVLDRLDVRGACDSNSLNIDLISGRCLVLSDIEGNEIKLLDPNESPNLRRSDILIECHPFDGDVLGDTVEKIVKRFVATHQITRIHTEKRCREDWVQRHPALRQVAADQVALAIEEWRPYQQEWLWLKRSTLGNEI